MDLPAAGFSLASNRRAGGAELVLRRRDGVMDCCAPKRVGCFDSLGMQDGMQVH